MYDAVIIVGFNT